MHYDASGGHGGELDFIVQFAVAQVLIFSGRPFRRADRRGLGKVAISSDDPIFGQSGHSLYPPMSNPIPVLPQTLIVGEYQAKMPTGLGRGDFERAGRALFRQMEGLRQRTFCRQPPRPGRGEAAQAGTVRLV